jgi:hypothetical protein
MKVSKNIFYITITLILVIMDLYRKNLDLIDVSIKKMGGSKNIMFCMVGHLFKGNSLIRGVKVFN